MSRNDEIRTQYDLSDLRQDMVKKSGIIEDTSEG